jgi:hypothetical protein
VYRRIIKCTVGSPEEMEMAATTHLTLAARTMKSSQCNRGGHALRNRPGLGCGCNVLTRLDRTQRLHCFGEVRANARRQRQAEAVPLSQRVLRSVKKAACAIGPRCCLKPHALAGLLERRSERGTTMRPWLLMFGTVLASIGLQAVQAQVTIDITEITCNQFLGSQITDSRTLGI